MTATPPGSPERAREEWSDLLPPYSIMHCPAIYGPGSCAESWLLDATKAGRGLTTYPTEAAAHKRADEIFGPMPDAIFTIRLFANRTQVGVKAKANTEPMAALNAAITALEAERADLTKCPIHNAFRNEAPPVAGAGEVVPVPRAMVQEIADCHLIEVRDWSNQCREILAASPKTLSPPVAGDREAIARIIDPASAELFDHITRGDERWGEKHGIKFEYYRNSWGFLGGEKRWNEALAKADAILALSPPSSIADDRMREGLAQIVQQADRYEPDENDDWHAGYVAGLDDGARIARAALASVPAEEQG